MSLNHGYTHLLPHSSKHVLNDLFDGMQPVASWDYLSYVNVYDPIFMSVNYSIVNV